MRATLSRHLRVRPIGIAGWIDILAGVYCLFVAISTINSGDRLGLFTLVSITACLFTFGLVALSDPPLPNRPGLLPSVLTTGCIFNILLGIALDQGPGFLNFSTLLWIVGITFGLHAIRAPKAPNHSMHQTLALRATAGDFES